jgi:hypothetical protein
MKAPEPAAGESDAPDEFFAKYGKRPPVALKKLLDFESEFGNDYAEGFELEFGDKPSSGSWSSEKGFSDSFVGFATADGSGSFYAFWIVDEDLEKCPIVAFGNEGEAHVVAENMLQLIRLLTCDTEISIDLDET